MATGGWDAAVAQASFIFRGTVERLDASTLAVPIEGRTAIVRVDQTLQAPPDFGDHSGTLVTVLLAEGDEPQVGQAAVFFTNGWLYGESLAVVEVSRQAAAGAPAGPAPPEGLMGSIADAQNRELAERVNGADLIVAGRVQGLSKIATQEAQPPISEHDPDWWEAEIEVREALAGQPEGKTVRMVFPNSQDVQWYAAHKPHPGQARIFLLRRGEHPAAPPEALTALHPLDVHRTEQDKLEVIRNLASRRRR